MIEDTLFGWGDVPAAPYWGCKACGKITDSTLWKRRRRGMWWYKRDNRCCPNCHRISASSERYSLTYGTRRTPVAKFTDAW